jgi:hypothetical protein
MTVKKLLSAKFSYGLSICLIALPLTFGVSAVRADAETPSWGQALIDPIIQALHVVDTRLASLESSVASFARSFTSEQIITRELCLADESGERTCITKAQLDLVLANLTPTAAVQSHDTAKEAAAIEDAAREGAAPQGAALEGAAIVIEPAVTTTTEQNAAPQDERVEVETSPAIEPSSAMAQAPMVEDEPMHTESINTAPSGDAIVSHPDVEIFTVPGAPADVE